jgi:NADH-quinone oxidoreductase subunit L
MVSAIAWVIPALPLAAFPLTLATGRRGPLAGAGWGIAAIFLSLVLSLVILGETIQSGGEIVVRDIEWLAIGATLLRFGTIVDPLSSVMLVVITVVAAMVEVYSLGYMKDDPRFSLYYGYLSLFTAAMLGLVLASNLVLLYACWEVMGLTSYLLIGFWFEKPEAMRAAKKAFLVTRVGDIAFFFGIAWLISVAHTVDLEPLLFPRGESDFVPALGATVLLAGQAAATWIALLLFGGAVGKSAQFPLHVWLPDAMEGPTPVSALIHAATMVAAGVYLVARMFAIFQLGALASEQGAQTVNPLHVVAWVGLFTALMAGCIALTQPDIKRVLAYSTISQLGYMMVGLGLGSMVAATFHLMTHAFFKALLFLGSGSVIHGAGTQDIREMGGLKKVMPVTWRTFMIGTFALAGVPPLAGFWSKDAILDVAWLHPDAAFGKTIFALLLGGAVLTAFYMTRLTQVVFEGEWRGGVSEQGAHAHSDGHHLPHESPRVMLGPLTVLAVLAVVAGLVGTPFANAYAHFVLVKESGEHLHGPNWLVMGLSVLAAASGIAAGRALYPRGQFALAQLARNPTAMALYRFSLGKFYFDELYGRIFVTPLFWVTRWAAWTDARVVDGLVNLIGWLTVRLSRLYRLFDTYVVDGLVNLTGWATKRSGEALRLVQTGQVQSYLLVLFLGAVALVWWLYQGW